MVWHVNENFEPKLAYFDKYLSMERLNKTKYVLGIYNAKCFKLFNRAKYVLRKYKILRRYHISVHFDIQRKML